MSYFDTAAAALPDSLRLVLMGLDREVAQSVREIHVHTGAPMRVTLPSGSFFIGPNGRLSARPAGAAVTGKELDEALRGFCRGSVYSFEETIKNGYIPFENGIRVGVAGAYGFASRSDVGSLCVRIPHDVKDAADGLIAAFGGKKPCGTLIFSPPGCGKTTVLRSLAAKLSESGLCVAVCDERLEFGRLPLCHVYRGHPKAVAMELAVRTVSPDVIVCDEIGGAAEAGAIAVCQNSGVPLVASAHAKSLAELRRRPHIASLFSLCVFELAYSLCEKRAVKLC